MINIVFIGGKNNKRIHVLEKIKDSKLHIIKNPLKLPTIVIDLFIIERINHPAYCESCEQCYSLKMNSKLKHIPIISLYDSNLEYNNLTSNCDLMVSELISDAEFENYVNTMIKMKLMDDELKKEKIILELKVKDRTIELQNKADKLNITMNSMGDGVIVTDVDGKITSINPTVKLSCNITDEEVINKNINDIFNFFINDELIDIFNIVKTTKQIYKLPIDSILKIKNIKLRISDSASPIFDKDGNFNGLVLVYHDVTDDYEMRKNLIDSEKRYRRLYDNIPDIIYTLDMNGNFTTINDAVNQLGYKPEDVIGKNISNFITGDDLSISNSHLENKKNGFDLVSKYNVNVRCKDGTYRIIELKTHLIKQENNDIDDEIFVIARDITNIIKSQNDLRIAKENAEKSDNMKTEFISNMTHELKTPLNSILGFSALISEQVQSNKLKEFADIVMSSGKKLSTLIEKIIDLADISSGSLKVYKKEFSLNKLLYDIQEESLIILNDRFKTNINLLFLENDDDTVFYGDYRRIKEIISEIIFNSIKFTNNGYIKYGYDVDDKYINIYIHDTGIGIEEKYLDYIFNSFYQINRQKQKSQEGIGLGLSLSKSLINLFKGDIHIDSIYGIGTTVSIKLPLEEKEEEFFEYNNEKNKIKSKKVLIIVENNETYGLLQLILLSQSFEIERSISYIDTINKIKDNTYDLIIIDVNNLSFNGFDLLDWFNTKNIKIPYIVSSNIKDDYTKWIINNPINTAELLETIKKIFV